MALLYLLLPAASPADVTIHCIDVGQGDATLIVSSSGRTLLFDGGDNGKGNSVVNPYLASLGIADLDYMVASHYHADHIGGLDEVYYGTGVAVTCYDRGWSYTTATYNSYANAVASKRQTLYDGQIIDLGDGVTVRCATLNGNGLVSSPFQQPPYDENDLCVALVVTCGEFDFFVAGDLSGQNTSSYKDVETSLSGEVGEVEVYQVDHHGSAYNSNATLVNTLSPEVSVISVGNNSYGHPSQTVINRLVAAGSYIYSTELGSGGTIPAGSGTIVGGHVIIHTSGYTSYTVDGDVYPLPDPTAVAENFAGIEKAYLLVTPNPCNPSAVLRFRPSSPDGEIVLGIFDARGRQVRRWQATGAGEILWDGTDAGGSSVASGVYFCRMLGSGGDRVYQKLLVTR